MNLYTKQAEYNQAMQKYNGLKRYKLLYKVVSFLNISMQLFLLYTVLQFHLGFLVNLLAFMVAFVFADFVNGGMHLYMDNQEDYTRAFGPFIAAFHLHHKTPKYKDSNVIKLYYNEAGGKFWLVPFQAVIIAIYFLGVPNWLILFATYFIVLSCVAEVSHFLAHNSDNKFVHFLQKIRVLIPKEYHAKHHQNDNRQYAFLNGMSDVVLDFIARRYFRGYKKASDLHYGRYEGVDTENRA